MDEERDLPREFGQRLRILRSERGMTQERLTELAGLDRNYVTEAERGKMNPTLRTMGRLADALGVNVVALLRDECETQD